MQLSDWITEEYREKNKTNAGRLYFMQRDVIIQQNLTLKNKKEVQEYMLWGPLVVYDASISLSTCACYRHNIKQKSHISKIFYNCETD
jgi:hypothetical protein